MQIEIDFEVFKAITARRESEEVTPNDVLRDVFGLEKSVGAAAQAKDGITYKGVHFPEGTQFRGSHKGKTFRTEIKNGTYQDANGKEYNSPSQAAFLLTGTGYNGWVFWECRRPGETTWQPMHKLRDKK